MISPEDEIAKNIRSSGMTIYDLIQVGDPLYWYPAPELERILDRSLSGISLAGYPLRTRSKVVKTAVCEALGYPVPVSFEKTRPRFPGQNFDTYAQKSHNLQVWNEELGPTRRYVVIGIDQSDIVFRVRVVSGDTLALLDRTGTLTQKYQARFEAGKARIEQIGNDTDLIRSALRRSLQPKRFGESPDSHATAEAMLPMDEVLRRLSVLVGTDISAIGADQERNRGAELHRAACAALGYSAFADSGDFPDIRHQLVEVKLQTSPTIDLGLVTPDSASLLDVRQLDGAQVRHCDVRYAVFYGERAGDSVRLTDLVLTSGELFYTRFKAFGGKVLNKKLQIPLPITFFDR